MSYTEIAWFSSRIEAETIGHALDQYDIPFLVQSSDIGVFGPGMTGLSPAGARLCVPEDRVAEVELLDPVEDGDGDLGATLVVGVGLGADECALGGAGLVGGGVRVCCHGPHGNTDDTVTVDGTLHGA